MPNTIDWQHNFSGVLGTGAGKHADVASERINAGWMNKVELAFESMYAAVVKDGMSGPYQFEEYKTGANEFVTETFNGNGTSTGFTISKYIPRETISGFHGMLDNPYESGGILPLSLGGKMSNFHATTNWTKTVWFTTAPPSGTNNVKVIYRDMAKLPSKLNSSAFITDYMAS